MTSERSIARARTRGTRLTDRAAPRGLSTAERTQIVDTFSELIEGLYGHLPLKRSMYAIDPIQRLRLLRQRVGTIDDDELHAELSDTLTALRDAHTRYIGPTALTDHVATLPFLVEAYGEPSKRRYIVSKIALEARRIHDPHFVPGVELLRWNAVPMDRAVDIHAERETGGRPDSRRSRALESFTFRALQYGPPPDEDWVIVEYRDLRGKRREVRFDWHVVKPGKAPTAGRPDRSRRAFAIDPAAETTRRGKKLLFAPELWYADQQPRARRRRGGASRRRRVDRHRLPGRRGGQDRQDALGHLRLPAALELRRGRRRRVHRRGHPAALDAPAAGADPRPACQPGRARVGRGTSAPALHAARGHDDAVLDARDTAHASDGRRPTRTATSSIRGATASTSRCPPATRTRGAAPFTPTEDANDLGQLYGGPGGLRRRRQHVFVGRSLRGGVLRQRHRHARVRRQGNRRGRRQRLGARGRAASPSRTLRTRRRTCPAA